MDAFRVLLLLMLLVVAGSAVSAASPAGTSGRRFEVAQAGHEGHEHGGSGANAQTVAPATAWAQLRAVRDAIAADVEAGHLGEIHAESERLVPAGNALLEGSNDLAVDKRTRLAAAVKQMPKLADALHEAADNGRADATRRQLKSLDGLLALIRAQYPADALGESSALHEPDHGPNAAPGHSHAERPLRSVAAAPVTTLLLWLPETLRRLRRVPS